jgi:hypothetical protein
MVFNSTFNIASNPEIILYMKQWAEQNVALVMAISYQNILPGLYELINIKSIESAIRASAIILNNIAIPVALTISTWLISRLRSISGMPRWMSVAGSISAIIGVVGFLSEASVRLISLCSPVAQKLWSNANAVRAFTNSYNEIQNITYSMLKGYSYYYMLYWDFLEAVSYGAIISWAGIVVWISISTIQYIFCRPSVEKIRNQLNSWDIAYNFLQGSLFASILHYPQQFSVYKYLNILLGGITNNNYQITYLSYLPKITLLFSGLSLICSIYTLYYMYISDSLLTTQDLLKKLWWRNIILYTLSSPSHLFHFVAHRNIFISLLVYMSLLFLFVAPYYFFRSSISRLEENTNFDNIAL